MMIRGLTFAGMIAVLLVSVPRRAFAQNPVPPDSITDVADTIPSTFPVPRGAFVRAMIVPGWGHLYIGEPKRGAAYAVIQGASWYMLVKTIRKLNRARDTEGLLAGVARDSVLDAVAQDTALARQLMCTNSTAGTSCDPLLFDQAIATYPGLVGARSLVTSRERHRQDWIVYTMFFTMIAAADAYVTAHLADVPIDISSSADGGVSIGVQLNIGRRP